uniref:Uncharacterized protein n=1 Tax=Nymphaea colorata TaxID=210225 RepID=A0A5K1HBS1_9MAGN|nr:unnamed protein product [Nymphaea colorata]
MTFAIANVVIGSSSHPKERLLLTLQMARAAFVYLLGQGSLPMILLKKLKILLYLLSCFAGSVTQDLWGPDEQNWITSYGFVGNDSALVHGLLKSALVGDSRTECNQFDNDQVTLLLQSEPRNQLHMMQNGSYSIVDQRFLYEKYESGFEEGKGE